MMPVKSTTQAHGVFREEFDAAWEYGGLWVSVWHPFLSGRLARAHAVKTLIEYMHDKGGSGSRPWKRSRTTSGR